MDQSEIIFLKKMKKPELFKMFVFKSLELALEELDKN